MDMKIENWFSTMPPVGLIIRRYRPEGWDVRSKYYDLRITLPIPSILDSYLRTIEPLISIVPISPLIWKSRSQVANCPRSRPKKAAALKLGFVTESEFDHFVDPENPMIQYDNIIATMHKTAFGILFSFQNGSLSFCTPLASAPWGQPI